LKFEINGDRGVGGSTATTGCERRCFVGERIYAEEEEEEEEEMCFVQSTKCSNSSEMMKRWVLMVVGET
jgi:hypothetical protein